MITKGQTVTQYYCGRCEEMWITANDRDDTPGPIHGLIERCWALVGPSQRIITCQIYQTASDLEVRVGYSEADVVYAVRENIGIDQARAIANGLRQAFLEKGGFPELSPRDA